MHYIQKLCMLGDILGLFGKSNANHAISSDQCLQLLFSPAFSASRPLGEHHVPAYQAHVKDV